MGWRGDRLGHQIIEELPERHHRVDEQVPGQRAWNRVDLVDVDLIAIGQVVDPCNASYAGHLGHAGGQIEDHVPLTIGDLGRELAWGAGHAFTPDVFVGVSEDLPCARA